MEQQIKGYSMYFVADGGQIIKRTNSPKGEKVSIVNPHYKNDLLYVHLQNDEGRRVHIPMDEVFLCARLGTEPGSDDAKKALKELRHQQSFMGRISAAVGKLDDEQDLVNSIHSDLIRQMANHGLQTDVDNMLVQGVAQLLLDYFKICRATCDAEYTITEISSSGTEKTLENPIFTLKLKVFDRLVTGIRALGLTFEKVQRSLPADLLNADQRRSLFDAQPTEVKGIVWNQ